MIKFTKKLANKIDNILKGFSEKEIVEKLIDSKPKNFKDIYCQGEFSSYDNLYIFNENPQYGPVMCFTVASEHLDANRIVNILNGNSDEYYSEAILENPTDIRLTSTTNDGTLITRGWGLLTGGLKLSSELAEKVQDDFIRWTCDKLIGKLEE